MANPQVIKITVVNVMNAMKVFLVTKRKNFQSNINLFKIIELLIDACLTLSNKIK